MGKSIAAEEKEWQAECDAKALAEASIIKKTPGRLVAATKAAAKMAAKAKKEAGAMSAVAKTKKASKSTSLKAKVGKKKSSSRKS